MLSLLVLDLCQDSPLIGLQAVFFLHNDPPILVSLCHKPTPLKLHSLQLLFIDSLLHLPFVLHLFI